MGTAFMFYSNSNAWAEGLEGWHGVDQLGEDGANPNYNAMIDRFEKRFGRVSRNVVVALAYDTARVAIHGIANAAIPEPRWVKEGMERIRWMPATNGGPGTYIQFGPYDRKGYKGDFLTIRELRDGELRVRRLPPPRVALELVRLTGVSDVAANSMTPNDKLYIHEFIDIIGPNRAKYMHHMTANWCPVARQERDQLCFGVWGTVGSTGRWPEVVNLWELDGWDGLVANFDHELNHPGLQDPSLVEWWATAAQFRRGGVDRIVVPEPWTRPVTELTEAGVRGEVYAHELVTVPAGTVGEFLAAVHEQGVAAHEALGIGVENVGAWRVTGVNDSEAILLWALPSGPRGPSSSRPGSIRMARWASGARRPSASAPTGAASSWSTPPSAPSAPAASPRSRTASPWTSCSARVHHPEPGFTPLNRAI